MTIGAGWAEGAWVDASWVVGAWAQPTATKTIGGTSQLGAITSTGGITVQNIETIGGTAQIDALSSTGGLNLGWQIGGTSQLAAFTSTGGIQVGEVVAPVGGAGARRRRRLSLKEPEKRKNLVNKYYEGEKYTLDDEKYLTDEFIEQVQEGKIEVAGAEVYLAQPVVIPKLELIKEIDTSKIKDDLEREIAILMREREQERYELARAEYIEEMKLLELEAFFVILVLLDDDL